LAVTYDAAGLDLDVAAGGVSAAGVPAIFYTVTDHTVATARDATNPKACYLVVEVTPPGQAAEGKAVIKDVCGTAAASPTLPTLTNDETLRQVALASFTLPTTASTTLTNVTDVREYLLDPDSLTPSAVQSSVVRRTDPTVEATTTSTTGVDATSLTTTVTLTNGVVYDLLAQVGLLCKSSASGNTAQLAAYLNGTGNVGAFVGTNLTDYAWVGNVHTLSGVTGTGAAIDCGVRVKVSGGTMTYTVGYLMVTAVPR
jgi:hypothetical protein